MRFLIKALLAATALLPVATAAAAQDAAPRERGERGDRPDRGDGQRFRGDRPDRPDMRRAPEQPPREAQRVMVDRDMSRGADWNANHDGGPANRGQARADVRADAQVDLRQRADRGAGVAVGVRTDAGAGAGWNGDRRRDDVRRDTRPAPGFLGARQDDRGAYRRNDGYPGYAQPRDGYAQQGRNWRNDDRGNDSRNWNRGWRTENRYNWGSYRAANRGAYRLPRYYAPYGWNGGYRRFSVGVTLNAMLFGENYWIDDPYAYRLPDAYGPYRWVRYYNDALLVDVRYGRVVDVVNDIFW